MFWRKSFVLTVLVVALLPCAVSRAGEPPPSVGKSPATPAELGFTGSVKEIREQASEFGVPGIWGPLRKTDRPGAVEAAKSMPLKVREPFSVVSGNSQGASSKQEAEFPENYLPREIPGFGKGQIRADGLIRAKRPDGTFMYSPVESPAEAGPSGTTQLPYSIAPVQCRSSGRRIKLVYAAPAGYTIEKDWEGLQPWNSMGRANYKILVESLHSSNGLRAGMPYVDCYPPGHALAGWPTISTVQTPQARPTFAQISASVDQALGRPTGANAVVHLVFFATLDLSDDPAGGRAQVEHGAAASKRSEQASVMWNRRSRNAVVYRGWWEQNVVVHELFHSLGAVADASPRHWASTGAFHCLVEWDVMCYKDRGPYGHLYPVVDPCEDFGLTGRPIDCLDDLYFRSHEGNPNSLGGDPGSPNDWLDAHWNVMGRESKFWAVAPPWQYPDPCPLC